jgi:hypothetical protein
VDQQALITALPASMDLVARNGFGESEKTEAGA